MFGVTQPAEKSSSHNTNQWQAFVNTVMDTPVPNTEFSDKPNDC
jgi:hypothetical protein